MTANSIKQVSITDIKHICSHTVSYAFYSQEAFNMSCRDIEEDVCPDCVNTQIENNLRIVTDDPLILKEKLKRYYTYGYVSLPVREYLTINLNPLPCQQKPIYTKQNRKKSQEWLQEQSTQDLSHIFNHLPEWGNLL